MTASTRSQNDDARARLESWAALGEACREASSEQITVTPAGVWTVHTRRQIARQPHVPDAEVLSGLRASPRQLPSKYFYDAAGSELFERICDLPEYLSLIHI